MRSLLILPALLLSVFSVQAQHRLEKVWQSDSIPVPESVLFSAQENILYVSQIDGDGTAKDGKGAIGKLATNGKTIDLNWVSGLNAPKGIDVFGDKMYVADITDVVVIDKKKGKVIKRIAVPGSKFLNDVTIDSKGRVFVSETRLNKIFLVENDVPSVYMEEITSANGLKAVGDKLYVLAGTELWEIDANKEIDKISSGFEKVGDGLEPVGNGDFIASCWAGLIYYVKPNGNFEKLLDTQADKMNTADIGYDAKNKIIFVPTFLKNSVVAYRLY